MIKSTFMPVCKGAALRKINLKLGAILKGSIVSPLLISCASIATLQTTRLFHSTSSTTNKPVKLANTVYDGAAQLKTRSSPIIIQHGLLGSKKNWASLAKAIHLKTGMKVVATDARNHGDSPHTDEFNYELLSHDLELLMNDMKIPKATLVGHSMGGRAVMRLALTKPLLVDKLVVVDISPIKLSPGALSMSHYLTTMKEANLNSPSFSTLRKSVDQQLEAVIKEVAVRQFILTNLIEKKGQFIWKVNLDSIIKNLHHIVGSSPFKAGVFNGPTLFIAGERSDYIKPHDEPAIREMFPNSQFVYIPNAGHWVHSEKPADFLNALYKFLEM